MSDNLFLVIMILISNTFLLIGLAIFAKQVYGEEFYDDIA